jgi:hypothetical protein
MLMINCTPERITELRRLATTVERGHTHLMARADELIALCDLALRGLAPDPDCDKCAALEREGNQLCAVWATECDRLNGLVGKLDNNMQRVTRALGVADGVLDSHGTADLITRIITERDALAAQVKELQAMKDCTKITHVGDGYLHAADYDGLYDIDGVAYCGRCHRAAPCDTRAIPRPTPSTLERDLAALLNRWSQENTSNTPDWVLAQYLLSCLSAWNVAVQQRETWYGRDCTAAAVRNGGVHTTA